MNEVKNYFDFIEGVIRQSKYHVPRNYKTIGGRWTVDTYKLGDYSVQLMDEGWTIKLLGPNIEAIESGNTFEVLKGELENFKEALMQIRELNT